MLHTNGRIYGLTNHGGTALLGSTTYGRYDDGGELFSYPSGSGPVINVVGRRSARPGERIEIIGQGFLSATGVKFGGIAVSWSPANVNIVSDTYMEVVVPIGARTGEVEVDTPTDAYATLYNFQIGCSGQCGSPMQ
jgi:hypothetical protein